MSDSHQLSTQDNQGLSELQRAFVTQVGAGITAKKARKNLGITDREYARMRRELPAFTSAVLQARAMLQEERVDLIHEIAAEEADVNRAKVKIDAIKWEAARYNSGLFGDRVDLTVTAHVSIADAMAAAKARAYLRPMCDPDGIEDAQVIESKTNDAPDSIDKQSTLPEIPDIFS